MENERDFLGGVLKIALGIVLGTMLIWIVRVAVITYALRHVNNVATASFHRLGDDAQRKAQERQLVQQRQKQAQADSLRVSREADQAGIQAQHRKEAAWAAFYHPSPECVATTSVECGNAHMRARREFERQYSQSQPNIL